MRHRIAGFQLNVRSDHRKAMLRNLAAGLFEHGQIVTTPAKAKAVQPFVERLITMAKKQTLASRRGITSRLTDRKVFAWVADPNTKDDVKASKARLWDLPSEDQVEFNRYGELRKSPRLVQHLISKVAPLYAERAGGYTRIIKLDKRRLGDATDLVMLQLVGKEEGSQVKGRKSGRRSQADKRTAFAKKARTKGAASGAASSSSAPAADAS